MKAFNVSESAKEVKLGEFRTLATFNKGTVGVFRADVGLSPWELHPADDEFLFVIEGSVEIVVLTDGGPTWTKVDAGSGFVVPKGKWHRHRVPGPLVEMWATPGDTRHSNAEDPRTADE